MTTTTRPELAGDFGMVASTHWLASQVGMSVLERGGNAFDAAAAAGFVQQVVEPHLVGPGGDLPVIAWSAVDRHVHVVCGQGVSPRAATPQAFGQLGLDAVPGTGPLAAVVPGAFGAWTLLLERWGSWPLRDVLEPAIGYALGGAPALPRVSAVLTAMAPLFTAEWTPSAATYLDRGAPPRPWDRLRLTRLGRTYQRILVEAEAAGPDRERQLRAARDAWYRGFVAEAIGAFSATAWLDTSGERHAGLLTADDLAGWQPGVEAPVSGFYRDVEVFKTGSWGQGPVLLQQLRLLDRIGLPDVLDDADPSWLHAVLEAMKLAFADREAWYGDSDPNGVPLADLLRDDYTAQRAALIDPAAASFEHRPGSPGGRPPRWPRVPVDVPGGAGEGGAGEGGAGEGEPTRGDTVHVDVVDRWGNLVSATPSGGWLQSSPVVPELGFPLGTRAQMFWLEPGLASSLRPGVRPRTTLSPSLAFRDGVPWLAFGTPGGDQQDQWSLMLLLRAAHGPRGPRQSLQACVDAPMLHSEHQIGSFHPRHDAPGRAVLEDRWPAGTVEALRRLGHDVELTGGWSSGRLAAVARDGEWLRAAADCRGAQGYAVGR
jgi:gamma-glutamyltranspeptidase/glutathione hydrolase